MVRNCALAVWYQILGGRQTGDVAIPDTLGDCFRVTGKQEVMYLSAAGSPNYEINC